MSTLMFDTDQLDILRNINSHETITLIKQRGQYHMLLSTTVLIPDVIDIIYEYTHDHLVYQVTFVECKNDIIIMRIEQDTHFDFYFRIKLPTREKSYEDNYGIVHHVNEEITIYYNSCSSFNTAYDNIYMQDVKKKQEELSADIEDVIDTMAVKNAFDKSVYAVQPNVSLNSILPEVLCLNNFFNDYMYDRHEEISYMPYESQAITMIEDLSVDSYCHRTCDYDNAYISYFWIDITNHAKLVEIITACKSFTSAFSAIYF